MFDTIISFIAPHYCILCNKTGRYICTECKNNITIDEISFCIECKMPLSDGTCRHCKLPYSYIGSWLKRDDVMKKVIDDYKYNSKRSVYAFLGDVLSDNMPYFSGQAIITYVPTARQHVRQRGFDHTKLIAKRLSTRRLIKQENLLERKRIARQVGADKDTRRQQVKDLYFCKKDLDKSVTYILIDDLITTGATIYAASEALKESGAKKIAVISAAYPSSN